MADEKPFCYCCVCGKTGRIMKRCSRCQKTFYCSRQCQMLDWVKHKTNCLVDKMQGEEPRCLANDEIEIKRKGEKRAAETKQEIRSELLYHPKTAEPMSHDCKDTVKEDTFAGDLCVNEQLHSSPVNKQVDLLPRDQSQVFVYIKYAKVKHKVQLTIPCSGLVAFKAFSQVIKVPVEKLKIIHKGKLQTEAIITEYLRDNAVFLALGEMTENEDGLDPMDIEIIMKQLSVDRNVAVKALRKTDCLLDAIFEVGNGS